MDQPRRPTSIEFTRNDRPTVGVELELHLVDAETGDLVSASNELLAVLGEGHPDGEHPKAKHELFQSTIEIITGICETPDMVRTEPARSSGRIGTVRPVAQHAADWNQGLR